MIDVMAVLKDIGELYKLGDFESSLIKLQQVWDSLPEPKSNVANSFLVITYAVKISMHIGDLEQAWTWASLALSYNKGRQDIGEAEFLVGKVAFERGDVATARELFVIADSKSLGRVFHGEDSKYRKLIKQS